MLNNLNKEVLELIDYLHKNKATCYLAGGFVRDYYLGIKASDVDIEVHDIEFDTLVDILEKKYKIEVFGKFAIIKVKSLENVDIALPRREVSTGDKYTDFNVEIGNLSTFEACIRRDFTINSMLYNTKTNELIDHFSGLVDLKNKVIRHVSDKFDEDPLRVLRGIKFASRYNFKIEPITIKKMQSMTLDNLPITRINNEFMEMMQRGNVNVAIKYLSIICPDYFNLKEGLEPTFNRFVKGEEIINTVIMLYLYSRYQEVSKYITQSKQNKKQIINLLEILNYSDLNNYDGKELLFDTLVVFDQEQYLANILLMALTKCEFKDFINKKLEVYIEGMQKYTGHYFLQKEIKGPKIKENQRLAIINML